MVLPCIVITIETTDLWDVEGRFSLKIVSAGNLHVSKDASVRFIIILHSPVGS